MVYIVDSDDRLVLVNRQFESLFGAPGDQLRGRSLYELFPPEIAGEFAANNRAVLESGRPAEFEESAVLEDGAHIYLSIKVPLVDDQGQARAICGISTDITTRKKAEEQLREYDMRMRRLIESNIIGMLVADMERITDANDLFLEMVGYTREDLRAGKLLWKEMTPPEYADLDARGLEELRERGACTPFEKEYYRKDGGRVPVLLGATLLSDRLEWLCFVLDLAQRKNAEEAVRKAQKLESVGFLAGGVAHNLNNLLVGILGNISLVLEGGSSLGRADRDMLQAAIDSGQKAASLTSQLLAYAGKGHFHPEPINPSKLIQDDLLPVLRGSISKKIAIDAQIGRSVPELYLDLAQARQLISNVVVNAAEAIGDREGRISIKVEMQSLDSDDDADLMVGARLAAGRYLVLTVSDTGEGIDEATRSRMFDPFFSTRFTGRGLGLAAVAGIVRAYKGGIRVWSSPGKGSAFQVYLPAAMVTRRAAGASGAAVHEREADGELILVIDDEEVVRAMAKNCLERRGFQVLVAVDGQRGMELLKQYGGDVSLVLLDLAMPVLSGEEALVEYRKIQPAVPIAICSGYPRAEIAGRFSGKQVAGVIQKPFTAAGLAQEVARLLKRVRKSVADR
jgi:PAS domain S-box-containing protein